MSRSLFEERLQDIKEDVSALSAMVEKSIRLSVDALRGCDGALARRVCNDDSLIDQKRYEIGERCLQMAATQQAAAGDLTTIVVILNVIVDLERMGDHAEGIARIAAQLADDPPLESPLVDIGLMAEKAMEMLRGSVEAFLRMDIEAARALLDKDDEIDALHDRVASELLASIVADQRTSTRATYLAWAAYDLNQIANSAASICERVSSLATGKGHEVRASRYSTAFIVDGKEIDG